MVSGLKDINHTINELPSSCCDLIFEEPVLKWDEAIPLGNGLCGCLIYGDGSPLKLSLDRGDLWDVRPAPETLHEDFTYKNLIKLVRNRDQKAIRDKFDQPYNRATPTKIPAGKMTIDFDQPRHIKSRLNLGQGYAEIIVEVGDEEALIKSFMHANKNIGCMTITNSKLIKEIRIIPPKFGILEATNVDKNEGYLTDREEVEPEISKDSLKNLNYPPVEVGQSHACEWFVQKTAGDLEYGIIMAQTNMGDIKTIVYCIGSNKDGDQWLEKGKMLVGQALELGFNQLLKGHRKWWADFWAKSSIDLPDKKLETMWYQTNYLFGSCSRKGGPPMPLQGVWTADDGKLPPWKGDYHNDLNTQFSYMHYLKANHIEEGEAFLDFLYDLSPQGRKFAKDFFDAPGLCLPSVMTIEGKPLGGWPMYSLNLTNQIWLCQSFERYWIYTGDTMFLKNKAYPYFEETAECILRWLKKDEKGKLYLPLSSSPEIHDDELESFVEANSHYDLALLHYLFKTLSTMAEACKKDHLPWEAIKKSLPELAVNSQNVLMISPSESLSESHRHHSHTMAIFPLNLLNYNSSEEDRIIMDATIENLEALGCGLWVGFSFTWMAHLYARQGNGEGASFQLKRFVDNLCSPNGFHLNGDYKKSGLTNFHYRPFTLESNLCAADALQEMLLQTFDQIIRVFPAIPDGWRRQGASFKDFRGMNGILISAHIINEKVEYIGLKAEKAGSFQVNNAFKSDKLMVKKANKSEKITCQVAMNFTVQLEENEACIITSK